MPKKAPKNAFYFYMLDFKETERKKGINYGSLAEVANVAGPQWRDAPPEVRAKFEEISKQEKLKRHGAQKFTSTGIPLTEIERQERELREAEECERKDILNLVKLKHISGAIIDEDIYIMDVNYYCKTATEHVIGESTILRFNLRDGIRDSYHEMINIGSIPTGYASDVKYGSQEYGLELPDESKPRSDYMQILANIVDYLKKDRNAKVLPPIFTMPDKIVPVHDFIVQICRRSREDEEIFRVYRLDTLFFTLINAVKMRPDEGFPKESLALVQLKKDLFKYNPGLGCAHHEISDKAVECTTSRVKRWAFTILDSCCPVMGIDMVPGKHLPFEYDMESILTLKEQKKGRMAPSVAAATGISVCNSSFASDSLNESTLNSTTESEKKEKRVHVPVRMPKNKSGRRWPAPELTEGNGPVMVAGRGRGLANSFSRLHLDE